MSLFDVTLFATAFATLTVIMDPVGTVPIFLGLTSRYSQPKQRRAAIQATSVSFGVILTSRSSADRSCACCTFRWRPSSSPVACCFSSSPWSSSWAPTPPTPDTGDEGVNVALVPLGTPLLAGPGSIVAVMVAVGQAGSNVGSWIAVVVAVVLAHVVMWLTMRFSLMLSRLLGPGGIMLLTKISGLLLAAIATQLIMEGIFKFIASAQGS